MKLIFVGAALLISVLSTDAQNHIPNPLPPPPLLPIPHSSPGSAQASYSGPAEYPNSPYPPPGHFGPKKLMQRSSKFVKSCKKRGNRKRHWCCRQRHPGHLQSFSFDPSNNPAPPQGFSGPPQGYFGAPQGYFGSPQGFSGPPQGYFGAPQGFSGPPQGYFGAPQGFSGPPQGYFGAPRGFSGPPQGYFGAPQGFSGPPQGYFGAPQGFSGPPQGFSGPPQGYPVAGITQESSSFPAQPPGSAVPPSSGIPAPPSSVSSGVKLPGNSTLPASGKPGSAAGNSGKKTSASKVQIQPE